MGKKISRRSFVSYSALVGAGMAAAPSLLASCKGKEGTAQTPLREKGTYYVPELADKAIDGRELKVGLVGCGGRGSGAIIDLLEAANGIKVTALGDVFPEQIEAFRKTLQEKAGQEVPDDHCFTGFEAYKQVIDSGLDMVVLATPPVFRPEHFRYATEKGVHSFLEKPVAVDAKGYRTVVATAKQALTKGLCVFTGTQRRHQREYVEAYKQIQDGLIGEITGGNVYWCGHSMWYKERRPGWSDMEYMLRDWGNWKWLSGDHIVEQHVHNIDIFMWMFGQKPIQALGVGGRHRRVSGDQYDCFSVDFEFPNNVHLHSMCRQIDGCKWNVSEVIHGTKGSWNSEKAEIYDLAGNVIWKFDRDAEKAQHQQTNPTVLEHVDWVNHIRKNEPHVEAEDTAVSSLLAVMGREAAYTGKLVKWDEISAADMDFMPEKLEMGRMDMSQYKVPVPGTDKPQK